MSLNTNFNLGTESDALFNELLAAHDGLSPLQSEQMNAALILLLINHIGDPDTIRDAIANARASLER
jgi:hypothetical protein